MHTKKSKEINLLVSTIVIIMEEANISLVTLVLARQLTSSLEEGQGWPNRQ